MRSEGQFSRLVKALAFELIDATGVQRFLFAAKSFLSADGYAFEYTEPTWTDPDTTTGLFSSGVDIAGNDTARSRLYATTDDNSFAIASVVSSQGIPFPPSTAELFAQTLIPASLARIRCLIDAFTNASRVEIAADTAALNGNDIAAVQEDTYTPALTNVNLGTTGTVTAEYQFIGGTQVGAVGWLAISAVITLNGVGFSVAANPLIALPAGFEILPILRNGLAPIGRWCANNTATQAYVDAVFAASAGAQLVLLVESEALGFAIPTSPTAAVPFAWGATDTMTVLAGFPAVRV